MASSLTTSATVPSATSGSKASSLGCVCSIEHAALAQLGAQCQQHVKHHAHAGDRLAGKGAAGLVRVDDHVRFGQHDLAVPSGGQVVVGHQHLQAQARAARHALKAGDAVVHRDQHVGAAGLDALGNRCGQAVAVDHAVGHDVADLFGAQQAQAANAHRAGGGAVAVVVGHDADVSCPRRSRRPAARPPRSRPSCRSGGSSRARPSSSSSARFARRALHTAAPAAGGCRPAPAPRQQRGGTSRTIIFIAAQAVRDGGWEPKRLIKV